MITTQISPTVNWLVSHHEFIEENVVSAAQVFITVGRSRISPEHYEVSVTLATAAQLTSSTAAATTAANMQRQKAENKNQSSYTLMEDKGKRKHWIIPSRIYELA